MPLVEESDMSDHFAISSTSALGAMPEAVVGPGRHGGVSQGVGNGMPSRPALAKLESMGSQAQSVGASSATSASGFGASIFEAGGAQMGLAKLNRSEWNMEVTVTVRLAPVRQLYSCTRQCIIETFGSFPWARATFPRVLPHQTRVKSHNSRNVSRRSTGRTIESVEPVLPLACSVDACAMFGFRPFESSVRLTAPSSRTYGSGVIVCKDVSCSSPRPPTPSHPRACPLSLDPHSAMLRACVSDSITADHPHALLTFSILAYDSLAPHHPELLIIIQPQLHSQSMATVLCATCCAPGGVLSLAMLPGVQSDFPCYNTFCKPHWWVTISAEASSKSCILYFFFTVV